MATLVLSTVGNALGGPVGGAIGALVGQSVDRELLSPARRGPRLGDLAVQTSSYGIQIPRIYGTMRVAGTVIWATDLVEQAQTGGAKGQPDVAYGYTVSMAVALSSRKASSIKRIWADGKLLRGVAGDLKTGGIMRFLDGSEDQQIDALIASVEGISNTPAYRGLAIAMFEDLELAEFGNRIPVLTFEIEADPEQVPVGNVLGDVSKEPILCEGEHSISGFAAYGTSIRQAIEPLVDCFGIELFDDGKALRSPTGGEIAVTADELGSSVEPGAWRVHRDQASARFLPSVVRMSFYDAGRDYQSGEVRAATGDEAGTETRHELPAVVSAGQAKALAQQMLARSWAERDALQVRLPPGRLNLEPGARIVVPFSPLRWSVRKLTIEGFAVVAELKPAVTGVGLLAADGGRVAPSSDIVAGELRIALLDFPGLSPNSPTLLLAASCPTRGWKRAIIEVNGAGQSMAVRTAARKSILGSALTILPPLDPSESGASSVDVQLIDEEQWLSSCDDDALADGANLASIGGELVQFGDAMPLGGGRFRLVRLLRGRAGTELAMPNHAIGETFCLIETASLQPISLPVSSIGKSVTAHAPGGGTASVIVSARADAIPAPSGGETVDQEARLSIEEILATLRQHGLIAT